MQVNTLTKVLWHSVVKWLEIEFLSRRWSSMAHPKLKKAAISTTIGKWVGQQLNSIFGPSADKEKK
jgi:hypothetical protein